MDWLAPGLMVTLLLGRHCVECVCVCVCGLCVECVWCVCVDCVWSVCGVCGVCV